MIGSDEMEDNKIIKLCPFKKMQINCGSDGSTLELSQKNIGENPDLLACARTAKIVREKFEECDSASCMAYNKITGMCKLIADSAVTTQTYVKTSEGEQLYTREESTDSFEMSKEEILSLACIKAGIIDTMNGYLVYADKEQVYENICKSESKSVIEKTNNNILINCRFFKHPNNIYRFECRLYEDSDINKLLDSYIATIDKDKVIVEDNSSICDPFIWEEDLR